MHVEVAESNVLQLTSEFEFELDGLVFDRPWLLVVWPVDWLFDYWLLDGVIWGVFWFDEGKGEILLDVEVEADGLVEMRQSVPLTSYPW